MRVAIPVVEVANEVCSQGTRSPLSVDDVSIGGDIEAKLLVSLVVGLIGWVQVEWWDGHTLLNFSRPPSVALMSLIHF